MKNIKLFFAFVLTTLFIVSSCSIERRVHQPGYHISWKNSQSNNQKSDNEQLVAASETSKEEVKTVDKISTLKSRKVSNTVSKKKLITNNETEKVAANEGSKVTQKNSSSSSLIIYEDKKDSKENEAFETQEKVNVNQNAERTNNNTGSQDDVMFILLILLCLIIPPLAVFLITEDLKLTLISLLLSLLFWLPGVIFAFYILFTRY